VREKALDASTTLLQPSGAEAFTPTPTREPVGARVRENLWEGALARDERLSPAKASSHKGASVPWNNPVRLVHIGLSQTARGYSTPLRTKERLKNSGNVFSAIFLLTDPHGLKMVPNAAWDCPNPPCSTSQFTGLSWLWSSLSATGR